MKNIKCGISVFPDFLDTNDLQNTYHYISEAAKLGYCEVFTSLHIPELRYDNHLSALEDLAKHVRKNNMELSVDISGTELLRLLQNEKTMNQILKIAPDWLRFDFGFSLEEVCQVVELLGLQGIMLNASVLDEDEVAEYFSVLKNRFPKLKLRAHHNYYPMPETGLSLEFLKQRSAQYLPYKISVTACVASHNCARLPLKKGLPTVEAHRWIDCQQAAVELISTGVIDSILIGDPYASQKELEEISDVCVRRLLTLAVKTEPNVTLEEYKIAFSCIHHSRPDLAASAIRSLTSREMAAQGQQIPVRHPEPREKYKVTVGNENALRYSGELNLITEDLPMSCTQNIIGNIIPEDRWKLDYIMPGTFFRLIDSV